MFAWLETTPIADWVALSLWAYPSLLSLHIVGLAVVVGIFTMRDLCLIGVIKAIDPAIFIRLGPLAWAGFLLNLTSGLLLFSSQATVFVTNTPFLVKISCIVAAMVLAGIIQSGLRQHYSVAGHGVAAVQNPARLRPYAILSLIIWMAAISAGRLIAYF